MRVNGICRFEDAEQLIASTNETEIPGYIDFSEKEAYNKNVTKMS